MSGSTYLKWCLSLTFLAVTVVAIINYVADPCGIYHHDKSWDWIPSRPEILSVSFIFKAKSVEQAQADVLLMGSSRTAEGLDPDGPAAPPHTYNLGIPDGSMYEDWRYLQHACAAHPPRTVVLGVDIDGFPANRKNNPLFSNDRLLVQPDGKPTPPLTRALADLAPTLFSLSTLKLSLETLRAPQGSHLRFDSGYEADAPKLVEHLDLAKNVFAANKKWVTYNIPLPYRGQDGQAPQMDAFERIVALCADRHIRLIVFVQPLHSALLDNFTVNWTMYSDWMKDLLARMESHPNLDGEFWDFASYNAMSTEPFPLPADTYSRMHYYWEGSHYHKIVGDMVLQRIFTGAGPASFGRVVTRASLDQDLQRLKDEKQAWHEHGQFVPINITTAPLTPAQAPGDSSPAKPGVPAT